jgi:thymidine kinase
VKEDRFLHDRARRRLGSLTVYAGPTHSGKTRKLEAEVDRARRQGRAVQALKPTTEALEEIDPATELVVVDDLQAAPDSVIPLLDRMASEQRLEVVTAGWELDHRGLPVGPLPELLCRADVAIKLDDGVCAQPGCRNLASRTQRMPSADGAELRFLPVCRRHHAPEGRLAFQEGWFDEPAGILELITGCMFSGKSQELIRRLDQERYAGAAVQVFKPAIDNREGLEVVASHRRVTLPAVPIQDGAGLEAALENATRVVAIDEVQFLPGDIIPRLEALAGSGRHVIAAGLDLDFAGRPFGPMPELLALADRLTKLQASCQYPGCGSRQATRTQRLSDGVPASPDAPQVLIGGSSTYQARCRHHHELAPKQVFHEGSVVA